MRITANLEFDTFAEAERVFRHLGMLESGAELHDGVSKNQPKANGAHPPQDPAHPTPAAPAAASTASDTRPSTAASPSDGATLDDVKRAFQTFLGKKGWHTTLAARAIMEHVGVPEVGGVLAMKNARPDQYAALRGAFETAGPENPLGVG